MPDSVRLLLAEGACSEAMVGIRYVRIVRLRGGWRVSVAWRRPRVRLRGWEEKVGVGFTGLWRWLSWIEGWVVGRAVRKHCRAKLWSYDVQMLDQ